MRRHRCGEAGIDQSNHGAADGGGEGAGEALDGARALAAELHFKIKIGAIHIKVIVGIAQKGIVPKRLEGKADLIRKIRIHEGLFRLAGRCGEQRIQDLALQNIAQPTALVELRQAVAITTVHRMNGI